MEGLDVGGMCETDLFISENGAYNGAVYLVYMPQAEKKLKIEDLWEILPFVSNVFEWDRIVYWASEDKFLFLKLDFHMCQKYGNEEM